MTELFTMIVLAANIIVASAFAKFAPTAAADVATAHERSSEVDTLKAGWWQGSRMRNVRSTGRRHRRIDRRVLGITLFSSRLIGLLRRRASRRPNSLLLPWQYSSTAVQLHRSPGSAARCWDGSDLAIWHGLCCRRARTHRSAAWCAVGDARTEPGTAQHIWIGIYGLLRRGRCALHCGDRTYGMQ